MIMNHKELLNKLLRLKDPTRAKTSQWFFKTNPGQYGYGDKFLGITVPIIRKLVSSTKQDIHIYEIEKLLDNEFHEVRLCALLLLVEKYKENPDLTYKTYMRNIKYVNNWDLVDLSARQIVGAHVYKNNEEILNKLARSKSLWERRISIVSTFHHLMNGEDLRTYEIADLLLLDKEDLVHKAVGWLLREAGKRVSTPALIKYLKKNKSKMARTTLRYAIEHLPQFEKQHLMAK